MKKYCILGLFCLFVHAVHGQVATVEHVVKRGETIESIAKAYGVDVDAIRNANSRTNGMFYVGLKLNIPVNQTKKEIPNAAIKEKQKETYVSSVHQKAQEKTLKNSVNTKESHHNKWLVYGGLSLNKYVGDDAKDYDNNIGFHAGVISRNFFYSKMFFDIGIGVATKGYKNKEVNSSGQVWDDEGLNYEYIYNTKMRTYNIEIPLHIGYEWNAFAVYAGGYMTYALSGKRTMTGTEEDWDTPSSSATEHINSSKDLSKIKDFKKFGMGVQIGSDILFNSCSVGVSFQRGLTKLEKDQKKYEQNILVTLGFSL